MTIKQPPAPPPGRKPPKQVLPSNYRRSQRTEVSIHPEPDYTKPFLVVLSYCTLDRTQAVAVLKWCKILDGQVPFQIALAHNLGYSDIEMLDLARSCFRSASEIILPQNPFDGQDWPLPQNWQFQRIASIISKQRSDQAWYFWEPDVVPIRRQWLTTFFIEYSRAKKPFMGYVDEANPHMNGSGVYPPNLGTFAPACFEATTTPWDVHAGNQILPFCHRASRLFQMLWIEDGQPFEFKTTEDVRDRLSRTAVTFTRCKGSSLFDVVEWNPENLEKILLEKAEPINPLADRALICLGRNGDIVNLLPLAYCMYEMDGKPPAFVVSQQFRALLDGVSYLKAVSFRRPIGEIGEAWEEYRHRFPKVHVGQVYCNPSHACICDAYNVEEWACAGYLGQFGKWPLVIDRRNLQREAALALKVGLTGERPSILVNLTGISSPYPQADALMTALKQRIGNDAAIIDLGKLTADRIFDLLGLMDRADVLLTSDTVTLHLAAASPIPTVALISDCNSLWHGTRPLKSCALEMRYRQSALMLDSIAAMVRQIAIFPKPVEHRNERRFHVVQRYEHQDKDSKRRFEQAERTWQTMYSDHQWEPVMVWETDRDCREIDPRYRFPFLKDIWKVALDKARDEDLVIYTNDDTVLRPEVQLLINQWSSDHGAFCGMRNNFERGKISSVTDLNLANTKIDYGRDIFVFKGWWLRRYWDLIPDAIHCCSEWDYYMGVLFRYLAGTDLSMEDMHHSNPVAEIPRGCVFHERHEATRYANKEKFAIVEGYSVGECRKMIQRLGIKKMHLSSQ